MKIDNYRLDMTVKHSRVVKNSQQLDAASSANNTDNQQGIRPSSPLLFEDSQLTYTAREMAANRNQQLSSSTITNEDSEKIVLSHESDIQSLVSDFVGQNVSLTSLRVNSEPFSENTNNQSLSVNQNSVQASEIQEATELKVGQFSVLSQFIEHEQEMMSFQAQGEVTLADGRSIHFDLALSMHTLEHVLNPHLFVSQIVKCIKPGGWLYLEVPDNNKVPGESMLAWGDQISGVHITHFTSQGLILLLMNAGLLIHTIDSTGVYRYPSLRIFARKLTASEDGKIAFKSAVDYQERIYKQAGMRLIKIISENPEAILWGAGTDLYQVINCTPELNDFELTIVDRNPKKIGKYFLKNKISDPEGYENIDLIIVTPASSLLSDSIKKDVIENIPNASIERLFNDK